MAQKTISLTETVFKKLQKRKPKFQSYSEFLDQLLDEKKPKDLTELSQFCGCLEESKEGEWDEILTGIYEDRKKINTRNILFED
jgi:predicted CopG family antitoxin